MKMKKTIFASNLMMASILIILGSLTVATSAVASNLTIHVENLRSEKGSILLALRNDTVSQKYLDTQTNIVLTRTQKASEGMFVLSDIKPGKYVISLFHDENDNGELDTIFMGIPNEGYGFSNNATAPFGPPSFDKAAFDLRDGQQVIKIKLRYLVENSSNGSVSSQDNMQLDSMQIVQQVMRMLPMGGDNASAFDLSGFSNSSADMILYRKGGDAPITFGIAIANFGIFHNCPNHMKDPLKDPLKDQ